jgi:hypothetical protein
MVRRLVLVALVAALAAPAASALGATRIVRDDHGRAITFDVRARGVNLRDYAKFMRSSIHGAEISRVVIHIVPRGEVGEDCGSPEAGGCYGLVGGGQPRIIVPAGRRPAEIAPVLLHEYGHHVDATRANGDLQEPNGTPHWWSARHMGQRLRRGEVAFDYGRGWSRSIGEIFAEDYVQLHLRAPYRIGWLSRPDAAVLAALRRDLGSSGTPPDVLPPTPPLVVNRSGLITPGEQRTIGFGLLGPGRRVELDVGLRSADGQPTEVRAEVRCDGRRVSAAVGTETAPIHVDLRDQGPASCEVVLTGVAGTAVHTTRLRLSRPGA